MKCPGQDMKYWKADAIFETACPKCAVKVEFYKDDTSRKCSGCGYRMVNPQMDFGCASYCQYAEQCLGALPEDFSGGREQLLKDKLAVEVKRALGDDFRRIRQVSATARFAENIGKAEGGNLPVILCAAYLQGLDAPVAAALLGKVGAKQSMIDDIATVIAETAGGLTELSLEARILQDALILQQQDDALRDGIVNASAISPNLHTTAARAIASPLR
jgi:hypothetical protein